MGTEAHRETTESRDKSVEKDGKGANEAVQTKSKVHDSGREKEPQVSVDPSPQNSIQFSSRIRAMEKELKKNNQFNHAHIPLHNGQRPLPQVSDHAPEEPKPKLEPEKPKKEMLAFMMLPQEEFGVRRPLGGDGMPKGLGGRHHWPMMSRTMTHVCLDYHIFANDIEMNNGLIFNSDRR